MLSCSCVFESLTNQGNVVARNPVAIWLFIHNLIDSFIPIHSETNLAFYVLYQRSIHTIPALSCSVVVAHRPLLLLSVACMAYAKLAIVSVSYRNPKDDG